MREILFRGKTKNELPSRWIYGSLTDVGHKWFIDDYNVNARVITETIGQYTGVKDKNGTKIFEGDILKVKLQNGYLNYKVVFNYGCFRLESLDGRFGMVIEPFEMEIVGNVIDNPELLGGENG